jgi:hypothetical protein
MAYELIDPTMMLRASCFLLGCWGILSSLEWLVDMPAWHPTGALGWELHKLRKSRLFRLPLLDKLFSPNLMKLWIIARLIAAGLLLITPVSVWMVLVLIVTILSSSLLILRATSDGADKMAMVVSVGALLQTVGEMSGQPMLSAAGWLWTGGQLTIAYATAGVSKIRLAPWRDGRALRGALWSYQYGHRFAPELLRHRVVAVTLSWAVMSIEILFPLALFAPPEILLAALALLLLLHVGIAVFMGLNTYPWAFAAAYPSVFLVANSIHRFL